MPNGIERIPQIAAILELAPLGEAEEIGDREAEGPDQEGGGSLAEAKLQHQLLEIPIFAPER